MMLPIASRVEPHHLSCRARRRQRVQHRQNRRCPDSGAEQHERSLSGPAAPPRRRGVRHARNRASHRCTREMTSWAGPCGSGFVGLLNEKSRRYVRCVSARRRLNRLEDDRGTDQPTRAHEERTDAGDHAVSETEIRTSLARATEDQQLLLDQQEFSDHGAHPARTSQACDSRQQMEEKDSQIAHDAMLTRIAKPKNRARV